MHERAVAKVEEQVADALARGARCLAGGKRHHGRAAVLPADAAGRCPRRRADHARGDVRAGRRRDRPSTREEEVVARANDTEYGLVAYVVTENGARQLRLGRALDYGMVAINRVKITGAPIPFGGIKQSGLGREGSRHGHRGLHRAQISLPRHAA